MATRERDRDRELLIPVAGVISEDGGGSKSSSGSASPSVSSSHHHTGREAFYKVVRSWASKKFMTGCVILLPMAITFYTTWWFIHFVDGFFSPIYTHLGINIFATPTTPVTPTTPTTPVTPAPKGKPTGWCVPKADVSDAQLQSNLDYACSQTIDCAPIRPGGACYDPNTVASHAAYAMNLLYQTAGRNPWNCDFSQTATVTSNNPSYNACIYPGGST